jgi:hypothetical protein
VFVFSTVKPSLNTLQLHSFLAPSLVVIVQDNHLFLSHTLSSSANYIRVHASRLLPKPSNHPSPRPYSRPDKRSTCRTMHSSLPNQPARPPPFYTFPAVRARPFDSSAQSAPSPRRKPAPTSPVSPVPSLPALPFAPAPAPSPQVPPHPRFRPVEVELSTPLLLAECFTPVHANDATRYQLHVSAHRCAAEPGDMHADGSVCWDAMDELMHSPEYAGMK